jgi:hypothetical protein
VKDSVLSDEAKNVLRAEIGRLRERMQAIASQINSLEGALGTQEDPTPPAPAPSPEKSDETPGFRKALLSVLASARPPGLTPLQIAHQLELMDIRSEGTSPILKRVYGDLYKLLNSDPPRVRRQRGQYSLQPAGGEGAV